MGYVCTNLSKDKSRKRQSFMADQNLWHQLKIYAAKHNMSLSDLINYAIKTQYHLN